MSGEVLFAEPLERVERDDVEAVGVFDDEGDTRLLLDGELTQQTDDLAAARFGASAGRLSAALGEVHREGLHDGAGSG